MNPLIKPSVQLRYLNESQKDAVLNKRFPQIDLSKYYLSIEKKNNSSLTIDFINGLFDGDGHITVSFKPNRQKNYFNLEVSLGIVQDLYNESLLEEIKLFFNNVGNIRKRNDENSISYFVTKKDIKQVIFPKLFNKSPSDLYKYDLSYNEISGTIIKLYKIYNVILIFILLNDNNSLRNPLLLDKIIKLTYNIIKNPKNLTLEEYSYYIKSKLL